MDVGGEEEVQKLATFRKSLDIEYLLNFINKQKIITVIQRNWLTKTLHVAAWRSSKEQNCFFFKSSAFEPLQKNSLNLKLNWRQKLLKYG